MDDKFKQLQEAGHNCVDCLMEWIKESKIIDETKETEAKARKLFDDIADQHHVELEKFKQVLRQLAEEQQKSMEQVTKMMEEGIPKLQSALANAAAAFQETMSKK